MLMMLPPMIFEAPMTWNFVLPLPGMYEDRTGFIVFWWS